MPGSLHAMHDGSSVSIRELRPSHREMYREAVTGLSPRSRYLRFAAPIPTISKQLLDRMMDFETDRHVAYAAFTPDETAIVGVARFVRSTGDALTAEVAVAVADDWQRSGIGSALLVAVIERARESDLEFLTAMTLTENRGAGRLARSAGFSLTGTAGVHADYTLALHRAVERPRVMRAQAGRAA